MSWTEHCGVFVCGAHSGGGAWRDRWNNNPQVSPWPRFTAAAVRRSEKTERKSSSETVKPRQ